MPIRRRYLLLPVLLAALAGSGCERALFAFVNRDVPPPDATVAFAPERGLSLDVYRPRGDAKRPAPTVVFFYGGAWTRGHRGQYAFVGHRLAERGVLAILPDYRTYPAARFPGFVRDAAAAVAWARSHAADYGGDPDRIFLMGHSAGGQIVGLLGTDARYLAAQGMAPRELAGVVGLSGPYDFEVGRDYAPIFGPPARWPDAQAVNFVNGDEPPFLLVHAAGDDVVEARDSRELAAKLHAAGEAATLLVLPGGSHTTPLAGLYDPARAPAVLPAILEFLRGPASDARAGAAAP